MSSHLQRVEKVWNTVNQRGIGNIGQMELHRMYHHDRAYPPSFGKWRTTIVWIRMQRRTTRKDNFLDGKFVTMSDRSPNIFKCIFNSNVAIIDNISCFCYWHINFYLKLFFFFSSKAKRKKWKDIYSCQRVDEIFYCENQIAGRLSRRFSIFRRIY